MSVHPMNSDILSVVFEKAIDSGYSSLSTIRSVNRAWFDIAGHTPTLWARLVLRQKVQFVDIEYARLHIQKSGATPLDVTVSLPDDLSYRTDMPALALLRRAVTRIRSIVITVPYFEAWHTIVTSIGEGESATALEKLTIITRGDVDDVRNNGPYTTFSTAFTPSPRLQYLQLPAWPIPVFPPPQFSIITTLVFDTPFSGLDIPPLFPLILAAPTLQHFKFKAIDMGAESDPSYSNVLSLPQLISADVTTPGFGIDLLGNFYAPNLVDVRLDGYRDVVPDHVWGEDDWGWDLRLSATSILEKLAGRSPRIRRLNLRYVHFLDPIGDFNCILGGLAFPALEELILERSDLRDISLIESTSKLPSLKKLVLQSCHYITIKGIYRFLEGHATDEFVLEVRECRRISETDIKSLSRPDSSVAERHT
ncbi:hypothetical protein CVT26_004876 [Gymnopilus dilepis]|uniref:F-box domain-containing protein n=1 Tax=Gymnopilus dilepis TaxID=231916 RepID=A0A409W8F2_9AGAR|nr:hypothetical protein CVT26_004876 [Gymnopilus dilepis]